ncbi:unnamed protein product [Mesocestoides corti]|uniref:SH2 domain-containing protein n=1 Tax=Mesocestoides corti TaxID=53468 RepID=A0A0R3U4A6_MESCO|nr:unnamed protein product [Mesocestoides corti]
MGSNWSAQVHAQEVKKAEDCSTEIPNPGGDLPRQPSLPLPPDFPEFIPNIKPPASEPTSFQVDFTEEDAKFSKTLGKKPKPMTKSRLYLFVPGKGHYLMRFHAVNPRFSFVHAKSRPAVESQTTRASQVFATEKFVKTRHPECAFPFYIKNYTTPIHGLKRRRQPPSQTWDSGFDGKIFLRKDNMEFVLPINGDLTVASRLKHGVQPNESGCCRASLLMKVDSDGDICRVRFDLEDMEFVAVLLRTSRGCQTEDPYIYHKMRGSIKPVVYIPLPLSTYIYHDPMASIRQRNHQHAVNGIEPPWMAKVRRERLCRTRETKVGGNYSGVLLSTFTVERGGYVMQACTGLLKARITYGHSFYDDFVRTHCSEENVYEEDFHDLLSARRLLKI